MSVASALMPLLRRITLAARTSTDSGKDLVELSVGPSHASSKGYYTGWKPATAAKISQNQEVTGKLWNACWSWAGLSDHETLLRRV